jgi:hypothetical protein
LTVSLSEVLTLVVPTVAVVLVITALVYGGSTRTSKRYRPGRPFEFTPVWFLSAPEQLSGRTDAVSLPAGPPRPELEGRRPGEPAEGPLLAAQLTGGASDRW